MDGSTPCYGDPSNPSVCPGPGPRCSDYSGTVGAALFPSPSPEIAEVKTFEEHQEPSEFLDSKKEAWHQEVV